ncbi:MAG: hypothetical protein RMH84_01835 [Sulfolobales archaeon]|nr:hypothetical protein [Sulfolobales archaeon]MCX8208236.1 hypothetical protein [Sulfolobales archaeon]MDW8010323.1 hypothetical protein [Sulfolobales archaeon]
MEEVDVWELSMRSEYRRVLEKSGIRVLDVYRRKDRDSVRFLYRGKVHVVDLKGFYDSVKPEELLNVLLSQVEGR